MILYCDTSALIKLYLAETDHAMVRRAFVAATDVAVCRLTWAEAMAAFARREREMSVDAGVLDQARASLRADWADFTILDATQSIVELAGDLAESFSLRGYDSVQLAAAKSLHDAGGHVTFACFDARLQKSARMLGMATLS